MKTTVLHAAILTLLSSPTLYALGLGDMKVHSYLNQPFHGEIELIDVKGISLASIKAGLASVEDYEHVGIEQGYAVNLLSFSIGKNKQGKPVIILRSSERITDPYLQLLVDLAWPDGQIYREYNILLDPPGYQLGSSTVYGGKVTHHYTASGKQQSGVVDKTIISHVVHSPVKTGEIREQSTYGPVKADENIWQIAQRYKTENVTMQQLVLAIVGMTPSAFENANLNGLKVGSKLTIPSTETVQQIPPMLANQEVNAHDEAWKNKSTIQHVLLPPYFEGKKADLDPLETASMIPEIAKPSEISKVPEKPVTPETPEAAQRKPETRGLMASVMSATSLFIPEDKTADKKPVSETAVQTTKAPTTELKTVKQPSDADLKTRAEISIATSAVESVKDANVILNEQLTLLRQQNQQLQAHLKQREDDLADLRLKIDLLLKERQSVSSQAYAVKDEREEASGSWTLWLLLLLLAGGGGFLFWYYYRRPPEDQGPVILSTGDLSDERSEDKVVADEEQTTAVEISEEIREPADAMKAPETSDTAIPATPVKEKTDKQITRDIEDDIDKLAVEELSVPPPTTPQASETASVSNEAIEEDLSDRISQVIEKEFPEPTQDKGEEKAIKDEKLTIQEEKIKPTEVKEETITIAEELSDEKNETLNPSFEKPLETPASASKEYGQDRDYKRPLSSLGELEIDEIQPVQSHFESVPEIELPEIDINELENYTLDSNTKEPEAKETKIKDDQDLEYHVEADKPVAQQTPEKKDKKLEGDRRKEENQDEFVLDFEPGLYQPEKDIQTENAEEELTETSEDIEHSLDFVVDEDKTDQLPEENDKLIETSNDESHEIKKEEGTSSNTEDEQTDSLENPLKSKEALDTLLALAKTYIGMDDIEAARQSLQEVIENGDKEQKAQAQQLLDELDKK